MKHALAAVALLAALTAAQAQTEADMQRLDELDRICEAARERRLAPLRAERIERCVRDEGRPREACQRESEAWGETKRTQSGARAGLFYDLPECKAAFEARQRYRR